MTFPRALLVILAAAPALACASAQPPSASPPGSASARASASASASASPPASASASAGPIVAASVRASSTTADPPGFSSAAGARLVTGPCVLHSGNARVTTTKPAGVHHASCSFDAECIAKHGASTPGDGFVRVECADTACFCEWSTPRSDAPLRAPFTLDAVPDAPDACKLLLRDRCMRGMHDASIDAPKTGDRH
jgi:hypothetical protein